MGNQNKIAYLDTDFINKTIKTNEGSSTLFDEIIKLPYEFRMVFKVYKEIKDQKILDVIDKYIKSKKIFLFEDLEIVNKLKKFFNEKIIQNIILSDINKISQSIFENDTFYNNYFQKLEKKYNDGIKLNSFLAELGNIVRNIPYKNNIGEIVTILNISISNRLGEGEIIALLSHDFSARRYVLGMPDNVLSYDCYSSFCLIKSIITIENAKKYAKAWKVVHDKNYIVKIQENGHPQGIDIVKFVEMIYERKKYSVLKNGLVDFK